MLSQLCRPNPERLRRLRPLTAVRPKRPSNLELRKVITAELENVLLYVRPPLGVTTQIPAGLQSGMRKQRVHAHLRSRRVKNELRFPVLLQNRVVMTDHNRAIRTAIPRDTQSKQPQIHAEGQDRRSKTSEKNSEQDSSKPYPKRQRRQCHDARL